MDDFDASLALCVGKGQKVIENKNYRVIAHIDLDCFYVQVERSYNASLFGKPVAVVQYNPFGDLNSLAHTDNRLVDSGSIIAVSYEARAQGVKRIMRGHEAKKVCPDMLLVQVPTSNGKADLTIYRQASAKIVKVLGRRYAGTVVIERASIDEVYLDLTQQARLLLEGSVQSFVKDSVAAVREIPCLVAGADSEELKMTKSSIRNGHAGTSTSTNSITSANDADIAGLPQGGWLDRPESHWSAEDKLLLAGVLVVQQLRRDVLVQLGFTCSAGIAPNKMLAKLASAFHKPNKQTVVPRTLVPRLLGDLPYSRIQGFGGKLGAEIQRLFGEAVSTLGDLAHKVPRAALVQHFGEETAEWIVKRAQGEDDDEVQDRAVPISIGCSKSFRNVNTLTAAFVHDGTVLYWLTELAHELFTRMKDDEEQNCRVPKHLHLSFGVKALSRQEHDAILKKNTHKKVLAHRDIGSGDAMEGDIGLDDMPLPDGSASTGSSISSRAQTAQLTARHGSSESAGKSESEIVAEWWEGQGISLSKVTRMPPSPSPESISKIAFGLLQKTISSRENARLEQVLSQGGRDLWGITYLGLATTQFEQVVSGKGSITSFLSSKPARELGAVDITLPIPSATIPSVPVPPSSLRAFFASVDATAGSDHPASGADEEMAEVVAKQPLASLLVSRSAPDNHVNAERARDGQLSSAAWVRVKRFLGDDVDMSTFEELPEEVRHELLTASYFQPFRQTVPSMADASTGAAAKKKLKTSSAAKVPGATADLSKWLKK